MLLQAKSHQIEFLAQPQIFQLHASHSLSQLLVLGDYALQVMQCLLVGSVLVLKQ